MSDEGETEAVADAGDAAPEESAKTEADDAPPAESAVPEADAPPAESAEPEADAPPAESAEPEAGAPPAESAEPEAVPADAAPAESGEPEDVAADAPAAESAEPEAVATEAPPEAPPAGGDKPESQVVAEDATAAIAIQVVQATKAAEPGEPTEAAAPTEGAEVAAEVAEPTEPTELSTEPRQPSTLSQRKVSLAPSISVKEPSKSVTKHSKASSVTVRAAQGSAIRMRGAQQSRTTRMSFRRPSAVDGKRTQLRYENSYRLEAQNPFSVDRVLHVLKDVMESCVDTSAPYDPDVAMQGSLFMCEEIRCKIKELNFDRYRLVVTVSVAEKKHRSVMEAMRFLWDAERDRYVTHVIESPTFYVLAVVFGIYYD